MKNTNKDLYELALGFYISNASEVIDELWENSSNWENVIIWQPFEDYSVDELEDLVDTLYNTFKEVRDNK